MLTKGYYAIRTPGAKTPLPAAALAVKGIAGAYLRYYWRDIEPTQGQFDWTALDTDIANVMAAGKVFSIGIRSGGFAPAWLYAPGSGIRSISYSAANHDKATGCTDYIAPVPYDAPYAGCYLAMMQALQTHLAATNVLGSLSILKITPFNDATEELHLPGLPYQPNTCESDAQSAWIALGYRPSLVLAAFETIYDGMVAAISGVTLGFDTLSANAFPGIDENGKPCRRDNSLAEAIVSYALSQTSPVAAEATDLANHGTNDSFALWAKGQGATLGFQSNCHGGNFNAGCPDKACDLGGYTRLLEAGRSAGAAYIEVWPNDVLAFPNVFARVPL